MMHGTINIKYRITSYIVEGTCRKRGCNCVLHKGIWRRGGIVKRIVNTGSVWRSVGSFTIRPFTPGKRENENGRGPQLLLAICRRRKSRALKIYEPVAWSLYQVSYPGSQGDWETNSWPGNHRITHSE